MEDVFHVTDKYGNKLSDDNVADRIQQSLGPRGCSFRSLRGSVGVQYAAENTTIELTGRDRPGLLSEVFAVLTDLKCNVVAAEIWTHNSRMASIVYITDNETGLPINDPDRLSKIKQLLLYVLKGDLDRRGAQTAVSVESTHTQRRLHQYVVFHATIIAEGAEAFQGLRLELCGEDRLGLLSDVTRIFRENGLSVTRAEVTTRGSEAVNAFYVIDSSGTEVKSETIEAVRNAIGETILKVKEDETLSSSKAPRQQTGGFSLGNLFRNRSEKFLYNLGLIRSCSEVA
ncbi:ACT domain-containing protein ACR4-like protein [Tanacetum coccineum]